MDSKFMQCTLQSLWRSLFEALPNSFQASLGLQNLLEAKVVHLNPLLCVRNSTLIASARLDFLVKIGPLSFLEVSLVCSKSQIKGYLFLKSTWEMFLDSKSSVGWDLLEVQSRGVVVGEESVLSYAYFLRGGGGGDVGVGIGGGVDVGVGIGGGVGDGIV
ncbi:hypothetical protein Tco_0766935 [Tanacetum coccineum]